MRMLIFVMTLGSVSGQQYNNKQAADSRSDNANRQLLRGQQRPADNIAAA